MKNRPWEVSEIPIGAVFRRKSDGVRGVLKELQKDTAQRMFEKFEWTWPHLQFTDQYWVCGMVVAEPEQAITSIPPVIDPVTDPPAQT